MALGASSLKPITVHKILGQFYRIFVGGEDDLGQGWYELWIESQKATSITARGTNPRGSLKCIFHQHWEYSCTACTKTQC